MITNMKEYMKKYREEHKKRIAELSKIRYDRWLKKNKGEKKIYSKTYIKEYGLKWRKNNKNKKDKYQKVYRLKHKKQLTEYNRVYKIRRKKIDFKFNLNSKISRAIALSIKGNKNGRHWETLVGYTCDDLVKRLKKTMPKGYTWQDYIQGKLHIDHIVPKSVFNYIKPEHIDFQRCWSLNNLQLLPAKENLIKGAKLEKSFQPALKLSL